MKNQTALFEKIGENGILKECSRYSAPCFKKTLNGSGVRLKLSQSDGFDPFLCQGPDGPYREKGQD